MEQLLPSWEPSSQRSCFGGAGGLWLTLLLAIAMLVIVFLPQWSPQTTLPGSKGSLMLIVGGIAAIGALLGLLALLPVLGLLGLYGGTWVIGLLLGIIGGFVMGWAGWKEFQAEGGKFQVGQRQRTRLDGPAGIASARDQHPAAIDGSAGFASARDQRACLPTTRRGPRLRPSRRWPSQEMRAR